MTLLQPCWSPLTCCEVFELFVLHSWQEEGQGRLAEGSGNWRRAYTTLFSNGWCVYLKRRGQRKAWKIQIFFISWPLVGPLPAGGWNFFGTRSVYYLNLSLINVMKINMSLSHLVCQLVSRSIIQPVGPSVGWNFWKCSETLKIGFVNVLCLDQYFFRLRILQKREFENIMICLLKFKPFFKRSLLGPYLLKAFTYLDVGPHHSQLAFL